MMAAGAFLLIGAYQGLAATLVLLVKDLPLGLSLTGIMVSAGLRLCGRGIPGLRHARLRHGLGHDSAAPVVHADPVRPGGARRAGRRFSAGFHCALRSCFVYLGLAWLPPRLAPTRGLPSDTRCRLHHLR